jgi:D-glycero-D-manno-heptose 1,7-bisphosphate phosphatase
MTNRAVFLDRDGVINDHIRYVNRPEDLILFPGTGEALKRLRDAGYRLFVVTNQGGVGLGYMTEENLQAIHQKMKEELALEGAFLDDIAYCPHKPHAGCACRKPHPTMITDLAKRHAIDLVQSYMIGDRETDIEAGIRAGTRTILIGEGPSQADYVVPDLTRAVDVILKDRL